MITLRNLALFVALSIPTQSWGLDFTFAGYVGNSGSPENPVLVGVDPSQPHFDYARFVTNAGNPYADLSIGPVYDEKSGLIYATAGFGSINAYALDGRVIRSFALPKQYAISGWERPRMNGTGSFLVIYTGNRHDKSLYKIPLDAPDGTIAQKVEAAGGDTKTISVSARNGKCLLLKENGDIQIFDPKNDSIENLCNIGKTDVHFFDWDIDGNIVIKTPREEVKFVKFNGKEYDVIESKSRLSGSGMTISGGYLWTCGGGTVNRYSYPSLTPDPGVVFGGASGSFLGVVVMNREMDSSQGIIQIKEGLFAIVSGCSQIIHLAQWDDTKKKLALVRRIGAIPWINTLLVDGSGNILINKFVWQWGSDSLSPLSDNYNDYIYESINVGNDLIVNFSLGYDHTKKQNVFSARSSSLSNCGKTSDCWAPDFKIHPNPIGAAAYKVGSQQYAILLDASGAGTSYKLSNDGAIQKGTQVDISLQLKQAGKVFSSLARIDDAKILIVVDGSLVEMKSANNAWQEDSRWPVTFDPGSKISVSDGTVFVAEKNKNLVSAFSLKDKKLLGSIKVDSPTAVSASGRRLVVFEEKNQRVSKFNLSE